MNASESRRRRRLATVALAAAVANNIRSDKDPSAMLERTYREPWTAELKALLA